MRCRASSVAAATTSSITFVSCTREIPPMNARRANTHEAAPDVVLENDDDDENNR